MTDDLILASFYSELQKIAQATPEDSGTVLGAKAGVRKGPRGILLGGLLGRFRAGARHTTSDAKKQLLKKASWGLNLGRVWGRSSNKAGWSTKFRSAGVKNPKALPKPKGMPKSPVKNQPMPKPVASSNNQVTLRRGLSNIETPKPK